MWALALRFAGILAGALLLVLGSIRTYGWLSLQRAKRHLATSLGVQDLVAAPPRGWKDTTGPAVLSALAALQAREEQLVTLAELATLPPGEAMTREQRERARQVVEAHAGTLDALSPIPGRPVSRLGLWERLEPEEEGKLEAGLLLLAQLSEVEGRLACEMGDPGRFVHSLAVLGGLATGLELEDQSQPVLVGVMVEHLQHLLLARGIVTGTADGMPVSSLEATLGTADLRLAYRRTLGAQVVRLETLRSPLSWSPVGLRSWLADAVFFDLRLAEAVDELARQAGEIDRSRLAALAASVSMPEIGSIAAAGVLDLPGRIQVALASRSMARAALRLRRLAVEQGAYPRELAGAPEALAALSSIGVGVVLEHGEDGSARLRVPGADEALRSLGDDAGYLTLLTWELPPVGHPKP